MSESSKDRSEYFANKVKKHSGICIKLNNIYNAKNSDYDDSFAKSYVEYGPVMSCIRLEDKLNRFKALVKNDAQRVTDESIQDTLIDLANYAIMTLIEMEAENDGH